MRLVGGWQNLRAVRPVCGVHDSGFVERQTHVAGVMRRQVALFVADEYFAYHVDEQLVRRCVMLGLVPDRGLDGPSADDGSSLMVVNEDFGADFDVVIGERHLGRGSGLVGIHVRSFRKIAIRFVKLICIMLYIDIQVNTLYTIADEKNPGYHTFSRDVHWCIREFYDVEGAKRWYCDAFLYKFT